MKAKQEAKPQTSRYEQLASLKDEAFRRLTGVKRATFTNMVGILERADQAKKAKGGRASKLCVEDRLLMALDLP